MAAGFGSAHLRVATLAERRREPALRDACRGEYAWAAVTAKEKLLQRAPHWSEEQAERALRAAESDGTLDGWGDLSKSAGSRATGLARVASRSEWDDRPRPIARS
jgi:hypothetical protein